MLLIYIVVLFIGMQLLLNKTKAAEKFKELKLRYLLVGSVAIISVSAVVGGWFGYGSIIVLTFTILCSSIIYYSFIEKIQS